MRATVTFRWAQKARVLQYTGLKSEPCTNTLAYWAHL